MSQAELERFVGDLKADAGLRTEVSGKAAGISSMVELAQAKGYDISAEEANAYIRAQAGSELSDEQLDAVAGAKSDSTMSEATVSSYAATSSFAVSVVVVT